MAGKNKNLVKSSLFSLTNIGFNLYHESGKKKFTVEFYEKDSGEKPCLEFLETLDVKLRAKVFRDMNLLEEKGTELRLPYSEHLDDGIFELRTKQGSNIVRSLYFFFIGNKIIITHGFRKKTQKTPPEEIERAKNYRKDYLARMQKGRLKNDIDRSFERANER